LGVLDNYHQKFPLEKKTHFNWIFSNLWSLRIFFVLAYITQIVKFEHCKIGLAWTHSYTNTMKSNFFWRTQKSHLMSLNQVIAIWLVFVHWNQYKSLYHTKVLLRLYEFNHFLSTKINISVYIVLGLYSGYIIAWNCLWLLS
jgi:hypothetical protein